MFLSDLSIKRPVFATMMMAALVVLGVTSYKRLAIDEYPDVTYPTVNVQTAYPGASPLVVEREVSRPIEQALNTVQGVKEVSTDSFEGSSSVRLMFNLGVDIGQAQQDVSAKIDALRRTLPQDLQAPVVRHFDPNDRPIMSLGVTSRERPIRDLSDLAEEVIAPKLETVTGVGAVDVVGSRRRQIRIQLDPEALRSYGVSVPTISTALARENQEVPAGRVRRGDSERLVRITGRVVDPKSFASIVVTQRNGVPVRISDLGTVVDGEEEARSASFVNKVPAVSIDVLKVSGANTVAVSDGVARAIPTIERLLPADVQIVVKRDDSKHIRDSLSDVQMTILLGALLTICVIYLFLNSWRSTVITGLTLPVSIISAFFIMWLFNFTINTMTLMALSLAIGLLIDDAIVVRENIVRHLEMGKDHVKAAQDGTNEIGLAVTSTSLAVVAVFLPVAFMGGMIGKIFFQFGVTVAFAVLVSLFVSFTLDPMLSSLWYDPEVEHSRGDVPQRRKGPIRRVVGAFNEWFDRTADRYPGWLRWALSHRTVVLGGALLSVVIAFIILPRLGFTWMPDYDGSEFNVNFRAPPGSRLEYTLAKGNQISELLAKQPEVTAAYFSVGGGYGGRPNQGNINVQLKPKGQRSRSLWDIQGDLRGKLRDISGVRASISGQQTIFGGGGGGGGQPIKVNVHGPELTRLKIATQQVADVLRRVPGITDAISNDEGDIPQLDVQVDREQAWAAGTGINNIATTLQPLFTGQRVTRWEDPLGYSHDVVVVYPDSLRVSPSDVADIPVPSLYTNPATGLPNLVPLSQIAEVRAGVGPQQLARRALEREITISAGILPGYAVGEVAKDVQAAIDSIGLPPGYGATFGGDVQNLNETKGYVKEALILAVLFIYLILASLFGSFVQPLAIMIALPLSFIGVALALLITRGNLNVMTMIGIIMLMGLVTKNGILLIDFTNQLRERGNNRLDALLSAGRIRLRPIIMTTTSMIFGMLPLAFAIGSGAEQRAPMARAVIGGLITSTMLTLFVVPVVYTLIEDGVKVLGRLPIFRRHADAPALQPAPASGD
jgi:HAE1 family hydrophobic/amphiphilic exporter-1